MYKATKGLHALSKQPFRLPKSAADLIPIDEVWEDGIFHSGKVWSKTYAVSEINYLGLSDRRKESILDGYGEILRSIGSQGFAQMTVIRRKPRNGAALRREILPLTGDGNDYIRREVNELATNRNGKGDHRTERYITISTEAAHHENAIQLFRDYEDDLKNKLLQIGSDSTRLDGSSRMELLSSLLNGSAEQGFPDDPRRIVCPEQIEQNIDYLKLGDRCCCVLNIAKFGGRLSDDFVDRLLSGRQDILLSVNFRPIPQDDCIRWLQLSHDSRMSQIYDHSQRQTAAGNFASTPPLQLEQQRTDIEQILSLVSGGKQGAVHASVLVMVTADTMQELEQEVKRLRSVCAGTNCRIDIMRTEQAASMCDALPMGSWKTHAGRFWLSGSLCVLHPFRTPEILDRDGIYLGINVLTQMPIVLDQSLLMNGGGFVLGCTGSGKSAWVKIFLIQKGVMTRDQILILDPDGEYWNIIHTLWPEESALVRLNTDGKNCLNPMEITYPADPETISAKSDLILSLVQDMKKINSTGYEKSLMDRCISAVYREGQERGVMPTLATLREKLLEQPESQAAEIALVLELYTVGSMDLFGHESTVDLNKRIIVFNTHGLAENLKSPALKIITSTILNRTIANSRKSLRTHIILDEFHWLFDDDHAATFFSTAWKQFRKRNAYPMAITQNVTQVLSNEKAQQMLSNSAMTVMLSQSPNDRAVLGKMLQISEDLLRYVTDVEPGCGLLKCGNKLIPFSNQIPRNTELYQLITTRPGEGAFVEVQVI